jgi:LytTr DNA-binding domain-containing protein
LPIFIAVLPPLRQDPLRVKQRFQTIENKTYVRLVLIFLAWTAYGVFFASQSMFRRGLSHGFADLPRYLLPWLLCAYCWAVLTPFVVRLTSRFPFGKNAWIQAFAVHIPAAIVFSLVQLALYSAVASSVSGKGMNGFVRLYRELIPEEFHQSVLVYSLIVAIYSTGQRVFKSKSVPALDNGEQPENVTSEYLSRVSIKVNGRILLLNVEDVDWIASEGNYVRLHSKGKRYLLRETMNGIEKKLDPHAFVRLRRSTIVRIDQIQELHPTSKGEFEVSLKDGTTVSSSRRYRKNLQAALII